MLYFTYGSNPWQPRFERRVGRVRVITSTCLPGHDLGWQKASSDGSRKCDVVAVAGSAVHGVLCEMEGAKMAVFDRIGGNGHEYERTTIIVDVNGLPTRAMTYRATTIADVLLYDWYKELVIAGAGHNRRPEAYVLTLECQPCKRDADQVRAARERSQLEFGVRAI